MLPVVALVGRPNVGKSTLFNALTRSRDALVADLEGLTRDRRYGVANLGSREFVVIDTGGLTDASEGILALSTRQARAAIDEADLIAFVLDARAGLNDDDRRIAEELRRTGTPVVLVANKTDGLNEDSAGSEFFELGFEHLHPISATHRRGLGSLCDGFLRLLPEPPAAAAQAEPLPGGIRVAVIGRPNVGKSTLINRMIGEERLLAFDSPGTTRDTIFVPWSRDGVDYVFIDTAGVRRRSKVVDKVEKFSVIKALQAIVQSQVVIVVLDAREGVVDQDSALLGHVLEAGRPLVIAVNKWDGLSGASRGEVNRSLERKLAFVPYARRIPISALHGSGLGELLQAVRRCHAAVEKEFSSSDLTAILSAAQQDHQPPPVRGHAPKLRYAHLGGRHPFRIVIHGNRVAELADGYRRYLMNVFRKRLDLVGVPVRLDFRAGDNPYRDKKNTLNRRQLAKRQRLKKFVKRRGK